MGQVADSPASDRSDSSPPADDKRLQGRRLALVRIAWGATALIGVGTFAARLPGHYADLQRVCVGPVCADGQLGPSAAQSFQQLGISSGTYAVLRTGLTLLVALTWFIIATMLAWRKANDWLALLVALWFIIVGTATITGAFGLGTGSTVQGHEIYAQAVNLIAEFGLIVVVFALFPTRRFAPRAAFWFLTGIGFFVAGPLRPSGSPLALSLRLGVLIGFMVAQIYHLWRVSGREQQRNRHWMTIGLTVFIGLAIVFLVIADVDRSLASLAELLFYAALVGVGAMQLSRYWQVTTPVGRQQTKWTAFGFAVFVITAVVLLAPALFMPSLHQTGSFYETIHTVVLIVASLVRAGNDYHRYLALSPVGHRQPHQPDAGLWLADRPARRPLRRPAH